MRLWWSPWQGIYPNKYQQIHQYFSIYVWHQNGCMCIIGIVRLVGNGIWLMRLDAIAPLSRCTQCPDIASNVLSRCAPPCPTPHQVKVDKEQSTQQQSFCPNARWSASQRKPIPGYSDLGPSNQCIHAGIPKTFIIGALPLGRCDINFRA